MNKDEFVEEEWKEENEKDTTVGILLFIVFFGPLPFLVIINGFFDGFILWLIWSVAFFTIAKLFIDN